MKSKSSKNQLDMINGPLLPNILSFSFIVLITNVIQLLFNTADLVVVGQFAGNEALGAVGATSALTTMFVSLFIGFSVGVSVICTHCYGSGDLKGFKETITTSITLSLVLGTALAVLGFFFSKIVLGWMDTPADLIDMSATYLKIYFLCMPALMFYNYAAAILRAIGNTKTPMYILSLSGVVNLILNLIFVIVFHMGVAGVALATTLSQYMAAGIMLLHMLRADAPYKVENFKLRIHKDKLRKILYIGIPNALHGTLISFSNVLIQSSLNTFSSVAVTGSSAAANIETYVYQVLSCFHQSSLNFIGQNYGAGKFDRIKKIQKICYTGVIIGAVVFGVGTYLCGDTLMKIFIKDGPDAAKAIAFGLERMSMILVPYFLCGLLEVITGVLCGLGKSVSSSVVSVIGFCGIRSIWILTVFKKFHTLTVLYMSMPVSWIFTFIVLAFVYIYVRHQLFPKKSAPAVSSADA